MKSCLGLSFELNGQGLGESRAGNQPTPPLVRYPGGVGPSTAHAVFYSRHSRPIHNPFTLNRLDSGGIAVQET